MGCVQLCMQLHEILELHRISDGEGQDPRQSHTRRGPGADHWPSVVQHKSRGRRKGMRWKTPVRHSIKQLLANCIKKYQNISKNSKNCQAWQMRRTGSPSARGAAVYSRHLSWRPGCHLPPSPPLPGTQNPQRHQGSKPYLQLPLQVWDKWTGFQPRALRAARPMRCCCTMEDQGEG